MLRARLGEQPGSPVPFELDEAKLPRAVVRAAIEDPAADALPTPQLGGSVVALPTRARQMAAESPEKSAAVVAEATRDLQRIAGEAEDEGGKEGRHSPATSQPRMPAASALANVGELVALRIAPADVEHRPKPAGESKINSGKSFL